MKNPIIKKRVTGFSLILIFIIADQLSKWHVTENILKNYINANALESLGFFEWITSTVRLPYVAIEIFPYFNLTMVWNKGISFGMLQNGNPWPLVILSGIIAIFFSLWLWRSKKWIETIPLAMIIGGAIGNMIDRIHFGAVADFLDFYIGDWHYPAFNLADSFITVGIVILIINSLFFEGRTTHKDKQEKKEANHAQ